MLAPNFPGGSQRRGFLTAMRKRTLGELQVELFNLLRAMPQYQRLISVDVEPSDALPCGWRAEIVGDFTVADTMQPTTSCGSCSGVSGSLMIRFALQSGKGLLVRRRD